MSDSILIQQLATLKAQMNNRSNKPLQRLQASLASVQYNALLKSLPGSTRKGIARGHLS